MKISVITVTYNSAKTLRRTLESVKAQDHPDIEHIVVDGASTDGTVELVKEFGIKNWISEQDEGMYDAINKGIKMATGEVIGILNSDDCYSEETILSQVADAFSDDELEAIYGDIRFVQKHKGKTQRYYSAKHFHPGKFAWGYMPPHPSFYARKATYEKLGGYQTDYTIAADYELLIRFLFTNRIKTRYLPLLMVDMLPGGLSNQSWKSRWLLNKEIVRACHENGIQTNMLKLSLKYFKKVFEYVNR